MKNWLLAVILNLITIGIAQANDKIAVVNMNILFQQVAQNTGVSKMLENEFKDRAVELQNIEEELQSKMQRLQHNDTNMKISERSKLEKDMIEQRQIFSQKAHNFEQERQRRSNEEREKLITRIRTAVKKVATSNNIGLVIDENAVAFNNSEIKNITTDVLKQVR